MKSKLMLWAAASLTILVLLSSFSYAQEVTGSIVGTVRDANGAGVPNATVTITDPTKNNLVVRTIVTNSEGAFSAPNLTTSVFSVTVEAPNFKKSVSTDVKVDVGQRRTLDVTLEAGRVDETVTVTADQVSVELSTPTAGTTINGNQVRELSLNNRNWVQLVAVAPGVSNDLSDQVYVGTTNPEGQANTINISVNGGRSSQNTFTVDGADVTDRGSNITIQAYPSVDSIGEFKVLRSLYPAESGRSGGGQINVVTRSGETKFHGSAYWFYRDEKLNANNFLANSQTTPQFGRNSEGNANRAPFDYDNYGWTISGPVYFLNFGDRPGEGMFRRYNKTFFFFSQEWRKDNRFSAPVTVTLPTADLRNGIFPIDVCINRNNQVTENCTAGNPGRLAAGSPIPANMLSPAALSYLNNIYRGLPLPNVATAANPFATSVSLQNISKFRQEIFKIDHSFSDTISAYYRYQHDEIPTIDGNALFSSGSSLPGVSTTSTNSPGKTHTFQITDAIRPNFILEGRYAYGYGAILSRNIGTLSLANFTAPITLPFTNQRDRNPSIAPASGTALVNGFQNLSSFGPYDNFSNKQNITGSATWILGNHTLKFGGVYSWYRKNENALAGVNEGRIESIPQILASGVTSNTNNLAMQRWANFLVGNINGFSQASFDYTADLRQKAIEAYVQDEWRFRPNLTLYMGVRYSYFGAPWDKNGRLSNFDPSLFQQSAAPQVTGNGARVFGVAGVPNGNWCNGMIVNEQNYFTGPASFNCTPTVSPYGKYVIDVNKTDFAPRVGIAWDPFGKGTTSIRSGYGIYHEQVLNGTFLQNIGVNPPYQINVSISGTNTRLDEPTAGVAVSTTVPSIRAVQTNWNTPYMQHWSLDIQQQIGKNTLVTAGYFGSRGTHLIGLTDVNLIKPGTALNSDCAQGTAYYAQNPTLVDCQTPGYIFRNSAALPNNPNGANTDILILDQIRPYKGYRSIAMVQPRYTSSYNSLQISGQHRFSSTSQVNLAYTWSKNLTDNQTDRSTAPQDSFNIAGEKSRATLDRAHILTINYIYELPFFKNQQGFAGKVFGGWQLSGIYTYQTGLPFTVTTSNFDPAGTGLINANPAGRPNVTCDPNQGAPQTPQLYFNISCFTTVTTSNNPGNAGRGIIEGPPTTRVDFTLAKTFRFGESVKLQLRGEAFNVLNHTNFRTFGSLNNTSGLFGTISGVRDPRTMQLAAKISF